MKPLPSASRCSFQGTQTWGSGDGRSKFMRYQTRLMGTEAEEGGSDLAIWVRLIFSHFESSRAGSCQLPARPAVWVEICQWMGRESGRFTGSSSAPPPMPALRVPAVMTTAMELRPGWRRLVRSYLGGAVLPLIAWPLR